MTLGGPDVVVAFSGCAPIRGELVRALRQDEPGFEAALQRCDALFRSTAGWSPGAALRQMEPEDVVTELPEIYAFTILLQLSMFTLLHDRGMEFGAVLGLSAGEVPAAFAAGAIGLEEAVRIAASKTPILARLCPHLRMAVVWLPERVCAKALRGSPDVHVAAVMEPEVTVIAGPVDALDRLIDELGRRGVRAHRYPLGWAAHSPQLAAGREPLMFGLGELAVRTPLRPLMLASLGRWADRHALGVEHWWDLVSAPAQFLQGVETMLAQGYARFIEVGPESAITGVIPHIGGHCLSFDQVRVATRGSQLPSWGKGQA